MISFALRCHSRGQLQRLRCINECPQQAIQYGRRRYTIRAYLPQNEQ